MDFLEKINETLKDEIAALDASEDWEEQAYHEGWVDCLREIKKWIAENSTNQLSY